MNLLQAKDKYVGFDKLADVLPIETRVNYDAQSRIFTLSIECVAETTIDEAVIGKVDPVMLKCIPIKWYRDLHAALVDSEGKWRNKIGQLREDKPRPASVSTLPATSDGNTTSTGPGKAGG